MESKNNNLVKLPFRIPRYKTYSINTAINGILEVYGDDKLWIYNNYRRFLGYFNKPYVNKSFFRYIQLPIVRQ